jgi:hypothetical protein
MPPWAGENPVWKRREGFNVTYAFADAVKSALSFWNCRRGYRMNRRFGGYFSA